MIQNRCHPFVVAAIRATIRIFEIRRVLIQKSHLIHLERYIVLPCSKGILKHGVLNRTVFQDNIIMATSKISYLDKDFLKTCYSEILSCF